MRYHEGGAKVLQKVRKDGVGHEGQQKSVVEAKENITESVGLEG
jgi:hypothetical protein